MPQLKFIISTTDDDTFITVFVPGGEALPASTSHPNFDAIRAGVLADDPNVIDLFDVSLTAARRFENLSERVSVANGRVYLDGDEVDTSLTSQIARFISEGVEDFGPLVAFFENITANPNDHSREQLYDWLRARDFPITDDGLIVGYKGVHKNADGELVSGWSGKAIVDGKEIEGKIPNEIGSTVEMPRSSVAHDPGAACSHGLHVGTYDYAKSYARGAMLEVHVNPRDVVSVPTDAAGEKVRVCRYNVVNVIDAEYTSAFVTHGDGRFDCDEDEADNESLGW